MLGAMSLCVSAVWLLPSRMLLLAYLASAGTTTAGCGVVRATTGFASETLVTPGKPAADGGTADSTTVTWGVLPFVGAAPTEADAPIVRAELTPGVADTPGTPAVIPLLAGPAVPPLPPAWPAVQACGVAPLFGGPVDPLPVRPHRVTTK